MRLYTFYKKDKSGKVHVLSPSTLEAKNIMDETFGFNVSNYNLVNFDMHDLYYEMKKDGVANLVAILNIDPIYLNLPRFLSEKEYAKIKKFINKNVIHSTMPNTTLAGCEKKYMPELFVEKKKEEKDKKEKKLSTNVQDIVRREIDRSEGEFRDALDIIKTKMIK